ncbi:MAG: PilZ domain-containing protein [Planctomycetes bacterium]|nr:PilZ domain-containing protein [Planctomycetota bacterium]
MGNAEVLNQQEISDVLAVLRSGGLECTMSYLAKGHWHVGNVRICEINRLSLQLELVSGLDGEEMAIDIDQPAGITFHYELSKYMFETSVIGYESGVNDGQGGRLIVSFPVSCERMPRRVYERVAVPDSLHVEVLFWHRGYTDGQGGVPVENYWQGSLIDLSAGGLLLSVEDRFSVDYRDGQLVGLQFTPLPHEKPLMVEGQIKYISRGDDGGLQHLGVEFVGLEACTEGRDKLGRIAETLGVYAEQGENCKV